MQHNFKILLKVQWEEAIRGFMLGSDKIWLNFENTSFWSQVEMDWKGQEYKTGNHLKDSVIAQVRSDSGLE